MVSRCCTRERFEAECVQQWGGLVAVERINALLVAIVAWLQGVLRQAAIAGQDLKQAVEGTRPPSVVDLLGEPGVDYGVATEACSARMTQLVMGATLRELPFWGMSRVRRANAVFERAYGGNENLRSRGRRVRFAATTPPASATSSGRGGGHLEGSHAHKDAQQGHGPMRRRYFHMQGHELHGLMQGRWRPVEEFVAEQAAVR